MLLDIENIGIAVGMLLPSCVQAEIYIISYLLSVPDAILTLSCTNIHSIMLFDAKNIRIPWKFYMHSSCNVRFKCFRFHVRYFDFRLNSDRILHRAIMLSVVVTLTSSKTNKATLNLLPKVIYTIWFNGHQVNRIFANNLSTPPSLLVI